MKMMFDAVSDLVSPGERLKLLDAVILNVLICNSDSHAKNYSILIGAGGSAKMAPLYDRMCAAAYRQVDQSLPQGISGRFHAPDLRRADWQALADEVGLSGASNVDGWRSSQNWSASDAMRWHRRFLVRPAIRRGGSSGLRIAFESGVEESRID